MSNIATDVILGQLPHLEEHIAQKKVIYEWYREEPRDLPVKMSPYGRENSGPDFWFSCQLIEKEIVCRQAHVERDALLRTSPARTARAKYYKL